MIAAEFNQIARQLIGAFNMLRDDDSKRVWYEFLKDYEFQDVDRAVKDYISSNTRQPLIADIKDGAESNKRARKARTVKQAADDWRKMRTVKCPYCNDMGFIYTTYPTGVEEARPCDQCPRGREVYPWAFLTPEEKEAWYKEEERKGHKPTRNYWHADEAFRRAYLYGK